MVGALFKQASMRKFTNDPIAADEPNPKGRGRFEESRIRRMG